MTFEALWYSMYSAGGDAPRCKRYCRLPMDDQWEMVIDLAISVSAGYAGYRKFHIEKTGEVYWYWPHPLSKTGWWLIPKRIESRANALLKQATNEAFRFRSTVDSAQITTILRRWKSTKAWRHHVWGIVPRHGEPPPSPGKRAIARGEKLADRVNAKAMEVARLIVREGWSREECEERLRAHPLRSVILSSIRWQEYEELGEEDYCRAWRPVYAQ